MKQVTYDIFMLAYVLLNLRQSRQFSQCSLKIVLKKVLGHCGGMNWFKDYPCLQREENLGQKYIF